MPKNRKSKVDTIREDIDNMFTILSRLPMVILATALLIVGIAIVVTIMGYIAHSIR